MACLAEAGPRRELFEATLEWSLGFLDRREHLVWSPSWYDAEVPAGAVHLTPNSLWVAYGLLCRAGAGDRSEAVAILERLLGLQHDAPGEAFDGTYARFPEAPEPAPGTAVMWQDYDPNWRQFVGTGLALVLEDFAGTLPAELVARIDRSIGHACRGEPPGRISVDYTNPALMQAWLLSWYGRRRGDGSLVARGRALAEALVGRFEELGAFEEFNSPTYYGIDLYALALWRRFPPTGWMAVQAERLEAALWAQSLELYNPRLRNWCGPFTRTYGPDATRSVTLLGLWHWAALGAGPAPLPALGPGEVHHGNDLMAGPVVARLARPVAAGSVGEGPGPFVEGPGGERTVRRRIGERRLSSWITPGLMLGAESSGRDWGGSAQFAPVTAHWEERGAVGTLWLAEPHVVRAEASERRLVLSCASWPAGAPLRLRASGFSPVVEGLRIGSEAMRITCSGETAALELARLEAKGGAAEHEIVLAGAGGSFPGRVELAFEPTP